MHTAICAFDDKDRARQAVDSLVRAGFARDDVHIEHRHARDEDANSRWDGMEREIAVSESSLANFGKFFAALLGRDHLSSHGDRYAGHVESGKYVVVVDSSDAAQAQRARDVLSGMDARDLDVVHRPEHRPLRDIVGMRQGSEGNAGMVERSRDAYEGAGSAGALERDRAMASPNVVSPTTGPALRDPDLDRAPGLRYADKDRPS